MVLLEQPPHADVANLVASIFNFWESSHAACKVSKPEQSRWLALAALLFLDLVVRYKGAWQSFKESLSGRSYRLLKAVAATISCLPMTSRASLTPDKYFPMQRWLQQHPQYLAALQAAISSPGVSWFLWSFTAAFTAQAAFSTSYKALADGSTISPDHGALLEFDPKELVMADPDGMISRLLSCLSHLHMHLPAEQVLGDLVEIRKQQEGQQGSSTSSIAEGSTGEGTGGAECSSSRANADEDGGGGSCSRYNGEGSAAAVAVAAGDAASVGCSCCGATRSPIPQDVPWLFTVLPWQAAASVPLTSSSTNPAAGPAATARRARGGGNAATAAAAEGGGEAAAAAEPCLHRPPPISLDHLKLFLELMLCLWPEQAQEERYCCWELLLLLVGLVQQAPVKVQRQLMQQRGLIMLRLMYRALLDDEAFGGPGVSTKPGCPTSNLGLMLSGEASALLEQISIGSNTGGVAGERAVADSVWEQVRDGQYDPYVH